MDGDDCPVCVRLAAPPTDPSGFYPARAARGSVEGSAIVECSGAGDASLTNCRAISDPPGYGFGAAAVSRIQAVGQKVGKNNVDDHGLFKVRVAFKLSN